jgi:hypothetical protein
MIDAPLTYCHMCGHAGKTTHHPASEDGPEYWSFACGNRAACGWELREWSTPITPRAVAEPHLMNGAMLVFGDDLDPRTPMHAREIWRLAALKVGADPKAAMRALLRPTSPSMDYALWALYIGSEEVYFVGEARTMEEATAMLKGMLL